VKLTILTSERELIDKRYMDTPTITAGPEIDKFLMRV